MESLSADAGRSIGFFQRAYRALEGWVEASELTRSVYRCYFYLPSWQKDLVRLFLAGAEIIPAILIATTMWIGDRLFGKGAASTWFGVLAFLGVLVLIALLIPWGWVFAVMTALDTATIWFLGHMQSYDEELKIGLR